MTFTRKQLEADVAFLVLRAKSAGSISFNDQRWTGQSSNALVDLAYGGEQTAMPSDRGDYAACVLTYARLPAHRKTEAVRAALKAAREAYLERYPEDRYPRQRKEVREKRDSQHAEYMKRHKRRRA